MALFLDSCVVISPTDGPFSGFQLFILNPALHNTLDIIDGTGLSNGYRVQIGRGKLDRLYHNMGMGIVKPGHKTLSSQIY